MMVVKELIFTDRKGGPIIEISGSMLFNVPFYFLVRTLESHKQLLL